MFSTKRPRQPHHHTGSDGLSSILATVIIRRAFIVDDQCKWFTATILNVKNASGPVVGCFMCSAMISRSFVSEIKEGSTFIVSGSLYRPIDNDTLELGFEHHAFIGEAHWLLRVQVPDLKDIKTPFITVSGPCATADNESRVIQINISPKLCIRPGDRDLISSTRKPSSLTTFMCYYPADNRRKIFTPPYPAVYPGDCVTVQGDLRYADFPSTTNDRHPFQIDISSMSIATVKIPHGFDLVQCR